jgi:hypothetical protein
MHVIKARHLTGFWSKAIGLIGKGEITPVYFHARWGIHTFGMRRPIDVVILQNHQVVKTKSHLFPNNIYFWHPRYDQVVELPVGQIAALNIKPGDLLKIICTSV